MMKKIVNTVPATDQMINSSEVSFLGRPEAPLKILIVGNSITRHGPKADIGWNFDWGMAASAPEKDYVHRLYGILTERGKDVYMRIRQASYWERNFKDPACLERFCDEKKFGADLVVFRLGENVEREDVPYLKDAIKEFMGYICPKGAAAIFTTCFWKNEGRDGAIAGAAEELGFSCVDISCTEDRMMALGQFEHHGVSIHPSDCGMEMIASRLADCIEEVL